MHTKRLRDSLLPGLLIGVTILIVGCPNAGTDLTSFVDFIIFQDRALESAIRAELGQPFGILTRADLLRVQSLDARSLRIESLSGLEYCINLTFLDLDTNEISDLSALHDLVNLKTLVLDSNPVFDISPLGNLLNLDALSLFNCQVGDIQALVTNAKNGGLGQGDQVVLDDRTLSDRAMSIDVPLLQTTYGVNVMLVTESTTASS